jgi:hypothetical protein
MILFSSKVDLPGDTHCLEQNCPEAPHFGAKSAPQLPQMVVAWNSFGTPSCPAICTPCCAAFFAP